MELAARIGAWSGKKLPYLRRVAYLESHGKEWIDTGITLTTSSERELYQEVELTLTNSGGDKKYFGSGVCMVNEYQGQWRDSGVPTENKRWKVVHDSNRHRQGYFDLTNLDDDLFYANVYIWSPPDQSGSKIYMFAGGYKTGPVTISRCRIHRVIIKIASDKHIYIPVLDLSGHPAMYDEVSGQLFYNQGTGEFAWGELDAASAPVSSRGGG